MLRPLHRLFALSLFCGSLAVACGSTSGVQTQKLNDGSFNLKCNGPLTNCLARADDLCHGKGYDVLGARDQRDRYGPEMGTAQTEVRKSEANIRCGSHKRPLLFGDNEDAPLPGEAPAGSFKLPPRPPADVAATPPKPARACVPGATQACFGPGKCEGAQSCLPDGSGFGPCDCGALGAPAPPPVSAPTTSAPATTTAPPPMPPAVAPKPGSPTPPPGPRTGTTPTKSGGTPPAPAPAVPPKSSSPY